MAEVTGGGNKFWTDATVSPKRNYRWIVYMGEEAHIVWYAKTVTTPSYEVSEIEHQFLDNRYYYPGRVQWNEVTLTLVDPVSPDAVGMTLDILTASGYSVKTKTEAGNPKTISKGKSAGGEVSDKDGKKGLGKFRIELYDPEGVVLETWTMQNAWVKSAKYGDLDYSSDELRTVELAIRYDWAECVFGTGENKKHNFDPYTD